MPKSSEKDIERYRRVDEVLHYLWDPIGVSHAPGASDEYYSYLPQVFALLQQGHNEKVIAEYLGQVTSLSMGMDKNDVHDLEIARILLDWKESIVG